MGRYVVKSVEVEAVQYLGQFNTEIVPWLTGLQCKKDHALIYTETGILKVNIGQWLIKGEDGEIFSIDPTFFSANYFGLDANSSSSKSLISEADEPGELEMARESAARTFEKSGFPEEAAKFRAGKCDHHVNVISGLKATRLDRANTRSRQRLVREAIPAAGLDPTDPCDCKIGDCKQSRMYCVGDRKQRRS